jgi:MoaA/NifB/PqqE/SkfB family radical SAM enzyme
MSQLGWDHLTPEDKAAILKGVEDGVAYGGPYHVELHPQDRCNIDCFFCSTAALRGKDEIPMPRFEEMLGELKEMGTRAIRLAGGGEPLFHRRIEDFLRAIEKSGLPIENITTNGVLLRPNIAELLVGTCEQVTVSLNTADATTYGAMMQTNEKNFQRVVDNLGGLVTAKRRRKKKNPHVKVQFLIWRENFRQIPEMYRLARAAGVDSILYNGLAGLAPDQMMTAAETEEMLGLYEELLRVDEYRKIDVINSFEQDISGRVMQIGRKIGEERSEQSAARRLVKLVTRNDFTLREKVDHFRRTRSLRKVREANEGLGTYCLIGWHSMLVRSTGLVAPCCLLQGEELGNIYRQSVRDVWYGEPYQRFRRELARIMRSQMTWEHDAERDKTVTPLCGPKGGCPVGSFYYYPDTPFLRNFNRTVRALETQPEKPIQPTVPPTS